MFGLLPQRALQPGRAGRRLCRVARLSRLGQAQEILLGKFGVDGQQRLSVGCGQAHGELHPRLRALGNGRVLQILPRREELLQQRPQLSLAPDAPGLDPAEHLLDVRKLAGQLVHLTQPAVHVGQLAVHRLEGLAEPPVELVGHGAAQLLQRLLVGSAQAVHAPVEGIPQAILPLGQLAGSGGHALRRFGKRLIQQQNGPGLLLGIALQARGQLLLLPPRQRVAHEQPRQRHKRQRRGDESRVLPKHLQNRFTSGNFSSE